MSRISDRIDNVIDAELTPLLTESGFIKERRFFRKAVEGRTQIINVWSHRYANHGNTGRFMVDIGIFYPEFHDYWNDEEIKGKPNMDACALRLQLNYKSPDSRMGGWWLLDENSDDVAVAAELAETVRVNGLPWLEMCSDPAGARAYLEKLGWVETLLQFEIVYSGEDAARATLNRLIESSYKGWLFKRPDKPVRHYLAETGRELGLL